MKLVICLGMLWGLVLFPLGAQEVSCGVTAGEGGTLLLDAQVEVTNYAKIIESLIEGLETEIFFEVRLYERDEGFFSLFGDKLVREYRPGYTAYFDPFEKKYVIKTSWGTERSYLRQDIFLNHFFSLVAYTLGGWQRKRGFSYYLRVRVICNFVKLIPPLNLISLFHAVGYATEWKEIELAY